MKTYTKPEMETIALEVVDVIATSSETEETETPQTLITWGKESGVQEMSFFE